MSREHEGSHGDRPPASRFIRRADLTIRAVLWIILGVVAVALLGWWVAT